MPKYSRCYLSLLASTLLLTSCGNDPTITATGTKAEGIACQSSSECKSGLSCYGEICRFNCEANDDCDVENYHCEETVCLLGKATICGNGILELGEDCDDGGRTAGDGCDANCNIEQGWRCVSQAPTTPHSVCNRTQGNCLGNFTGENCDQCKDNFTGDNCNECKNGYIGSNCIKITCQNGTPDEKDGSCSTCDTGWVGADCNQCKPNYYGSSCQQCNCLHGTCKDGIEGNGKCQCEAGWEGENCDQETICPTGFTGLDCDKCLPEYYGLNCKPCTCIHGECNDTMNGDGYCRDESCETGWTGKNCSQCADSRFSGPNCDQCADSRFSGPNCDQCANHFTGDGCDHCEDNHYGENCDKEYGSFTASDGNTYKTFVFNNQTWMAENLRYSKVDLYSADNKSTNDETYGYLYIYANAMKACPDGWRLPTSEEFLALIGSTSTSERIDTTTIQDTSWVSGATNISGFSALPAGLRFDYGGFFNFGSNAYFWSSTPNGSDNAYSLSVRSSNAGVYYNNVNTAFSVRCLKDEG